jgi:predicted HNH restriction endonuclease
MTIQRISHRCEPSAMWNQARVKTAMHMLDYWIKSGHSDTGTEAIIEGSTIFGTLWWPIVRDAVLARDRMSCKLCKSGELSSPEVHHIIPRHRGGSDHPLNLVTLCSTCHKMIHRNRSNENWIYHKMQATLEDFI